MKDKDKSGNVIRERELCNALPSDEDIDLITYDFEILKRAVLKKRRLGATEYPSPDEILDYDDFYQWQCSLVEQAIDAGIDYSKLPSHMKSG